MGALYRPLGPSTRRKTLCLRVCGPLALTGRSRFTRSVIGSRISAYEVLSELGSGGMGSVYLARCAEEAAALDAGVQVALKVIHPNLLSQPGFFKRFLREAQIGQEVQHENVVRTYDCDATDVDGAAAHFLVMEYVEGQTLRDLLDELERVPEELCRHIGREVAKGLAAIHEAGVVHRDIKPENVLITEGHVVKVMDLGVARLQDEAIRLSQAGAFVGSLEYAAPEQFRSADAEPDGRADLHSLGVVLYELATGQHPYRDEDISKVMRNILDEEPRKAGEINPQLSPFFEEVIGTLIAKERDARFADAATLAGVLEEGEGGEWWKARAKALRVETKRPLRRIRIPRETALYGRDDDLAKLHALFDNAKAGNGQVLLIEGEAGIGKTRLVDEFVGRLRQEGEDINFLFGSYPPGGAATAAGAFSEAYREQFGEEGAAPWLSQTPILVPAFDALLRGEPAPKDAEALTKDSLGTVFVHATRNLAAERPTIVLIDDLHFAPEDARALFLTLALAAPGHPILLVGTMRPGVDEEWISHVARLDQASHTGLLRLGPKDLFKLLKDSFRSDRLAEELGMQISVKSDGNPFFAFEIIRGLREGQFITQQLDGTWASTQVVEEIQIPSSLLDLVNARVAGLSEAERDLLDVACCCGFEFDPGLIGDVLGLRRIPLLKRFGQIERAHRLVRSSGRNYVFDHHQVQEALYGSLHEQMREEYHAAIADALEARANADDKDPKDLDGALCVDLCEHFLKGAQGKSALRYLDAALTHLEVSYLNESAIKLAERALASPSLLEGDRRFDVLYRENGVLGRLGRRDAQAEVLADALALANGSGNQGASVKAEQAMAYLLERTGRYELALPHARRALDIARATDDRRGEIGAIIVEGLVRYAQGMYSEAIAQFEHALLIALQIDDLLAEASVRHNLGNPLASLGRIDEAWVHFSRAAELYEEVGDLLARGNIANNLGLVLVLRGRLREAESCYERALAYKQAAGDRASESVTIGNLGQLQLMYGSTDHARVACERALTLAEQSGALHARCESLHALGMVAAQAGELVQARGWYEQASSVRNDAGSLQGEAETLLALGECLLQEGHRERSDALMEAALALARETGARGAEVEAACHLALRPGGDVDEALACFDARHDALAHRERMRARYLLFKATGRREHLAEARRLLNYFVEHAPAEHRESMLTNVRLHREIMEAWEAHQAAS